MVGLSDIPVLGKAVDKISDVTVEAVFRRLHYMFHYKHLGEVLDSEIRKLNSEKDRMSIKVRQELDNGKIIYDDVLTWQKSVEELQGSAKEFSASWKCMWHLPIPNLISRFRRGREAVQKASIVAELTVTGTTLLNKEIAYLPPVEDVIKSDTEFQSFQSRKDAYKKLWEELVTEDSSLIHGIYGMPGVGKTRLMEQISEEAKEKKIFDKVIRINVSNEELDVIDLQKQIANNLNCHLDSQDNVNSRASQLRKSLMNRGKILVVLDDVWRKIPLRTIGIPCADEITSVSSKILLTSRQKNVCQDNNCKDPVNLTPLTVAESWDLFSNTVGVQEINTLLDKSLAKKVCNKCAGLPLIIHAVGKALKFMSHDIWKDALEQLENCVIEDVPGISAEVYACLKMSFDRLVENAKRCLLLCSLFPEDDDIHIRKLSQLATASHLLSCGKSTVPAMVDILKLSSLLLEGKDGQHFKLHDIIRDVARSIALKDPKYALLYARCGSRLPDDYADYGTKKLIHLDLEKNDFDFPPDLACPGLQTLSLRSSEAPKKILQEWNLSGIFENLRFLLLTKFSWQLQFSLQSLGKLKTLILDQCVIIKTDVSFFPEKLETLCIWDCHLPSRLDLPNLKYLRKLEIQGVRREVKMMANTISRLSSLKELHIPNGVRMIYDAKDRLKPTILDEITNLTRLRSLQFVFNHCYSDAKVFSNLSEFDICVGVERGHQYILERTASGTSSTRCIALSGYCLDCWESLVETAEEVILMSTDVNVSSISKSNREAFADLRYLHITDSQNMEYLAKILPEEILYSFKPLKSFSKLITLKFKDCYGMKYLCCESIAKCLVQLQELSIDSCLLMEAIVVNEGTSDGEIINFSRLKSLTLSEMPRLKSFYMEKKEIHPRSTASVIDSSVITSSQFQPLFDGMVAFPSLEELRIRFLDISDIWGKHYHDNDNVSSFCNLKTLDVSFCCEMETVIPLAMSHRLQNLESLSICNCTSLISEIGTNVSNTAVVPLVALGAIVLKELRNLTKTGFNSRNYCAAMTLYPNLKELSIHHCNSLRNVFLPSIARDLIHLADMRVQSCEMMTEIIGGGAQEDEISDDDNIVFPHLMVLKLADLPNLTSFWCYQSVEARTYKLRFPNLVDFKLSCGGINLEEVELGRDDSTCQLKRLDISCDTEIQLPCTWQLRFHNLERLTLRRCWWHELKSLCFPRLEVLKVHDSRCSALFSCSGFRSLQQLQELEILNCALLEEIVEDARVDEASDMDKNTVSLFQLRSIRSVTLKDLPNLKSFIHGANYECHMPALKKVKVFNCGLSALFAFSAFKSLQQLKALEISKCSLLEEIVEVARGDEAFSMDKKTITLVQLSSVILTDSPNLKSFLHNAKYDCHMPVLKEVEVENCGFSTLFSFSVFENLQQLKTLQISKCRLLEGIVEEEVRGDETSDTNDKLITLFRLSMVVLRDLPNLRSFSGTATHAFRMPRLYIFSLRGCPRVKNFITMKTGTHLTSNHAERHAVEEFSGLNDYIKQNRKRRSYLDDSSGELSYGDEEVETKSVSKRREKEKRTNMRN